MEASAPLVGGAAVLSSARWSAFRLSKHFIALAFAEVGWPSLYVDPTVSLLSPLRQPTRLGDLLGPRIEKVDDRLSIWRPVGVPGQDSRVGLRVNGRLLAGGVARHLERPEVTILFSFQARGAVRRLPGKTVYHCTDSVEDRPDMDTGDIQRAELELAGSVDLVTACSLPLVEQLAARGVDAHYVPHGCDAASFVDPGPPPDVLAELRRPLVGFVGSVNHRVDPALLAAAADATDGGTLVVIGGGFGPGPPPGTAEVLRRPDVVATGHRPPEELPAYMAALDVGIVPYLEDGFGRKSFPIKVAQYLACGLPVVSTPNGATDEYGAVVEVASGPAAFAAAVRRALEHRTEADATERRRIATERPWTSIVGDFLRLLDG
ncbi:MAG TPA: glycosyltransferase [Acidimicrobiales bacterium]|nr:glycosyltransferase [Acidimicrobiales bacterium]